VFALLFWLCSSLAPRAPAQEAGPPADAAGLTALLLEKKDEAEPELVRRLANLKTPEALEGLLQVHDALASLYLRLIVVRSLSLFDGVAGADTRALQKLLDLATRSSEIELREAAVDAIADCPQLGRGNLRRIVDSAADDAVRERALRHHLGMARPEDVEWYRRIWRPDEAEKKGGKGKKGDVQALPTRYSPALRALAFEGVAAALELGELEQALESTLPEVRRSALEQLVARRAPDLVERAERVYGDNGERPGTRLFAAGLLLSEQGPRCGEKLFKDASRGDVPLELALGIADLLSGLGDPKLEALILKNLGQGQPGEKLFTLRAARSLKDPKVDKALRTLAGDKDLSVRIEAVRSMGARGGAAFVPELEELLEESKEETLLAAAFDALDVLQGADPAWQARLVALGRDPRELLRNAALEAIGRRRNPEYLPVLEAALDAELWSTRLAAARALEAMRLEAGVGALCRRVEQESGRMALEFSEILWRLTGQPFKGQGSQWKRWWEQEGAGFTIPSAEELRKRELEREERRLRQVTRASTFFGVRVVSHRVCFVIDTSGSMEETLPGDQPGERGPTRIEVARRELLSCLDALEAGTSFNLIPFSSGVEPWKESAVEGTQEVLAEAREFVQRLGALGGTNIHGALAQAFADPSVDTIYFLSDGEPSVGELTDPLAIRQAVQSWNEHRGVVIHTISVGDRFPLLQWLAEDSGGTHTTFP
jgi:Mg-chelatase subunit ChlD